MIYWRREWQNTSAILPWEGTMRKWFAFSSQENWSGLPFPSPVDHVLSELCPYSQSYGFSSSHVWMWELDHKESWAPKNWCFWTVVLETTLESPLDWKEIKPINPKGNQSWIFIGRTDAEAETPILWPPDAKNWLTGKDSDAGKDWGQEEKGMTEDEMVVWHHQLNGYEFKKAPGVGDGIGRPGVLQPMWLQTVRHDWATELNWTDNVDHIRGREINSQLFHSRHLDPEILYHNYLESFHVLISNCSPESKERFAARCK